MQLNYGRKIVNGYLNNIARPSASPIFVIIFIFYQYKCNAIHTKYIG